jgi:hypothetical protein
MLREKAVFVLVIAVICANRIASPQGSNAISHENQRVRCTMWMDKAVLLRGSPGTVHLWLENTSSANILITSMTGHLRASAKSSSRVWDKREEMYWSSVDLDKKSALKPVHNPNDGWTYPETNLPLKAKSQVEFTLDLSALEWANEISAGLPSLGHYGAVPDGGYQLNFDLGARDAMDGATCNKTDVEIRSEPRSKSR